MMSMSITALLTHPITLAGLAFSALMCLGALVAYPIRRQMFVLAERLLADKSWSDDVREEINHLLDTCMSFRIGFLFWFAVISVVADIMLDRIPEQSPEESKLANDQRFQSLFKRYVASTFAANPLAAVVTIALMVPTFILAAIKTPKNFKDVVEEPILRASEAMPSSHRYQLAA